MFWKPLVKSKLEFVKNIIKRAVAIWSAIIATRHLNYENTNKRVGVINEHKKIKAIIFSLDQIITNLNENLDCKVIEIGPDKI